MTEEEEEVVARLYKLAVEFQITHDAEIHIWWDKVSVDLIERNEYLRNELLETCILVRNLNLSVDVRNQNMYIDDIREKLDAIYNESIYLQLFKTIKRSFRRTMAKFRTV